MKSSNNHQTKHPTWLCTILPSNKFYPSLVASQSSSASTELKACSRTSSAWLFNGKNGGKNWEKHEQSWAKLEKTKTNFSGLKILSRIRCANFSFLPFFALPQTLSNPVFSIPLRPPPLAQRQSIWMQPGWCSDLENPFRRQILCVNHGPKTLAVEIEILLLRYSYGSCQRQSRHLSQWLKGAEHGLASKQIPKHTKTTIWFQEPELRYCKNLSFPHFKPPQRVRKLSKHCESLSLFIHLLVKDSEGQWRTVKDKATGAVTVLRNPRLGIRRR